MNVDVFDFKSVLCECGNEFFNNVMIIKYVPAIMSPNGQEAEVAVQILRCTACGVARYPEAIPSQESSSIIKV